jgi:hypothetical protein
MKTTHQITNKSHDFDYELINRFISVFQYKKKPFPIRVFSKIIKHTPMDEYSHQLGNTLITGIHSLVTNLDIYSETNDQKYKMEANNYREMIYSVSEEKFGQTFVTELNILEGKAMEFFPFERELWERVMQDIPPTDDDIKQYMTMRAGDSHIYAKIIEAFTHKDLTLPIKVSLQLLDYFRDTYHYHQDLKDNLPNSVYMALMSRYRMSGMPEYTYSSTPIYHLAKRVFNQIQDFDFKEYQFFKREIKALWNGIENYPDVVSPLR